jgi:hypothetical protein
MFRLRRVPTFEATILQWLDRFNSCMHNDDDGLLPGIPMTRIDHPGNVPLSMSFSPTAMRSSGGRWKT